MASYNKVILMGNLTRDPELKFLQSGTPVLILPWRLASLGQISKPVRNERKFALLI